MLIHNNKSSTTHTKCAESAFYFGQNKKKIEGILLIEQGSESIDRKRTREKTCM
jgi:hypothetical protein